MRSVDDVKALIDSKREQIVDARAANRFRGEAPEPRAGLRGGHMPGAFNLPYNELLDPKTGTMLPADKLAARIAASGIDPSKKVTASCGSGVSACVVALGLYLTGAPEAAIYDGSWTEWGGRADTPIVTGRLTSSPTSRRRAADGGCRSPSRIWRWCRPTGRERGRRPTSTCDGARSRRRPPPSTATSTIASAGPGCGTSADCCPMLPCRRC